MKYRFLVVLVACSLIAAVLGGSPVEAQPANGFGSEPAQTALDHLQNNAKQYDLSADDLRDLEVTDVLYTSDAGAAVVHLQQRVDGVDIVDAVALVVVDRAGNVLDVQQRFVAVPDDAQLRRAPQFTPISAVSEALDHLSLVPTETISEISLRRPAGGEDITSFTDGGVALQPITTRPVFVIVDGVPTAGIEVEVYENSANHFWRVSVDAATGDEIRRDDFVDEDSYDVYEPPVEAPSFVSPTPPADGRTLVTNPADPTASPFGWHDTNGAAGAESTRTIGNNVEAYTDIDANNVPDTGSSPDGGAGLNFQFGLDLTQAPSTYRDAAVTNLFFWNNFIHDTLYNYGFDETAGNFQTNNYGNGGSGGDAVLAEAQDGSGTNNANFLTPPDGTPGRMQMFLFTGPNPDVDGDFDNGIIAHEYAHGLSNRLVGGPSNVSCLNTNPFNEQMGEGWSDYLGLVLTMEPGDQATDSRGIGTYALGQATTGNGIRAFPYSTDFGIDPRTYDAIKTSSVPHGVGSTWAAMLWDMTWGLIDEHGYDPDLSNGPSSGGNGLALQLVIDGMKLTACGPGFVDARDAILLADQTTNGGDNECIIWEAFAGRGLGESADQGTSASRSDGTEAFDLPAQCRPLGLTKTASAETVPAGGTLTYTLEVTNGTASTQTAVTIVDQIPSNTTYVNGSASCAATLTGTELTLTVGTLATGASATCTFDVTVDSGSWSSTLFFDDMDSGLGQWTTASQAGSTNWVLSSTRSASAPQSAFAADVSTTTGFTLTSDPVAVTGTQPILEFTHFYNAEQDWDGGVVEISSNGGAWTDLGSRMTQNGYPSTLRTGSANPLSGRAAFTGLASDFLTTSVDLSDFSGSTVEIRFRFGSDGSVGDEGWYVDDVFIGDRVTVFNEATAESAQSAERTAEVQTIVVAPTGTLCQGQPITVNIANGDTPTAGNDVILGTSADDIILAGDGDDVVCGGLGNDTIIGGPGDDVIDGEAGNDSMSGNGGDDELYGGDGVDEAFGGSGDDLVSGGDGDDDVLGGGSDSDTVLGEDGDDRINGGSGDDGLISGGPGNDRISAGGGNDTNVHGDAGNDIVGGNGGKDTIDGDDDDDQLFGGNADDIVRGGAGDDFLGGNDGVDTCDGGAGNDTAAGNCETLISIP